MATDDAEFRRFVAAHRVPLLRSAWLLTRNWAGAEDLVQVALLTTWQRWAAVDNHLAYAHRVLFTQFVSLHRRRWSREEPLADVPDRPGADGYAASDRRRLLLDAVYQLPARQRAVVVLRYFQDFSIAQTAAALSCSEGNVKSQASRALATLRADPGLADYLELVTS